MTTSQRWCEACTEWRKIRSIDTERSIYPMNRGIALHAIRRSFECLVCGARFTVYELGRRHVDRMLNMMKAEVRP